MNRLILEKYIQIDKPAKTVRIRKRTLIYIKVSDEV